MNVQGRRMRTLVRAGIGSLALAASLSFGAPALGQEDTSCVESRFTCEGQCTEYETCFDSESESTYHVANGRRFDCDGLDCRQANVALDAFCCPTPAASAADADAGAGATKFDGGCSITRPLPDTDTSLAAVGVALASLWTFRRRKPS
jgi:hypothetical protein